MRGLGHRRSGRPRAAHGRARHYPTQTGTPAFQPAITNTLTLSGIHQPSCQRTVEPPATSGCETRLLALPARWPTATSPTPLSRDRGILLMVFGVSTLSDSSFWSMRKSVGALHWQGRAERVLVWGETVAVDVEEDRIGDGGGSPASGFQAVDRRAHRLF